MAKILVDANVLIDLYSANADAQKVLDELIKHSDKIVFPEQVYDEFRRLRAKALAQAKAQLTDWASIQEKTSPSMDCLPEVAKLNEARTHYKAAQTAALKAMDLLVKNPSNDPILIKVRQLCKSPGTQVIRTEDAAVQKAQIRAQKGNPPYSENGNIGDQIIWESTLDHVQDDLVVATRDNLFHEHELFLAEEYKERTGKALKVVKNISQALEYVGEKIPKKIKQADEAESTERASLTSGIQFPPWYQLGIPYQVYYGLSGGSPPFATRMDSGSASFPAGTSIGQSAPFRTDNVPHFGSIPGANSAYSATLDGIRTVQDNSGNSVLSNRPAHIVSPRGTPKKCSICTHVGPLKDGKCESCGCMNNF